MESSVIVVTIPGEPKAQGRARAVRFGNSVHMYDPKGSAEWKGAAAWYMKIAMKGRPPIAGAVRLSATFLFAMPKSRCRKKAPRPAEWHTKKPDLDNLLKAVKDAAKGILWVDDSQVCEYATVNKRTERQGAAPGVTLWVEEIGK